MLRVTVTFAIDSTGVHIVNVNAGDGKQWWSGALRTDEFVMTQGGRRFEDDLAKLCRSIGAMHTEYISSGSLFPCEQTHVLIESESDA
jgi:hypothetical protein